MKITDSGMPPEEMWSSFFSPQVTLEKMGLQPGMASIVDLGCGYGTFTIPAANMFPKSEIIAIDIESAMIETVQRKARNESLKNITAIQRDFTSEGTGLADHSIDFVMLFNILHAQNPVQILNETFRILKKGAIAGIMHWIHDSATPRGPDLSIRPKPEQIRSWAREAGFSISAAEIPLPPYHYGVQVKA